jgi:hypothetical protein
MMNRIFTHLFKGKQIKEQAKRNNEILRGARAMNRQLSIGLLERGTEDYDLFSKKPKQSALELERELDKKASGDFYYVKPLAHIGTFRVMDKGNDLESPHDDFGIVDYTKEPKGTKKIMIDGIWHSHISERIKDAKQNLSNPLAVHRHAKARGDLERIKISKIFKR